jgi:sugar lactone lactonase YvrE
LNGPFGVFVDGSGNIFIGDTANNRIREVVASTGNIQTVAGNGTAGFSGDGGLATSAELDAPFGVFVDGSGDIFIADEGNNRIREVTVLPGAGSIIQTVAGTGIGGYSGDGGPAVSAGLVGPSGVFVDGSGNVFIADSGDNRIREIVVAQENTIETIAGDGTAGFAGDGGPATSGAELNAPIAVYVDGAGNILIGDADNNRIREVVAATGDIQTIAGNGTTSFGGDGGPATSAELDGPDGIFVDPSGNIFVADTGNNRVREVVAATEDIQTVAGNGTAGFGGDGGPATSAAELNGPVGVLVDGSGNILIADNGNNRIREVVAATGNIQTIAGNGTAGFGGDGGPAISAELDGLFNLSVGGSGNIFFADRFNARIREVVAATGNIQTVVGNGTGGFSGDGGPAAAAGLSFPAGVFVDNSGNIFIADDTNNRIREVLAATGDIQTVAGNGVAGFSGDGGPATNAELSNPIGVFVDRSGNIFIADTGNNRIREIVAATGNIQTVAGNGVSGFSGDGGSATSAELSEPIDLFSDGQGNLFIADYGNNRIRRVAGVVTSAPANITATGGTPQSTTVNTAFATPFSVTVTDANGNPVAGVTVSFSLPAAGANGSFANGITNFVTNASGVATSSVYTANTVAGSYTVTAVVAGVAAPANFLLTNNPGPPASIAATTGTPQSATINTAFGSPFAATVKDSFSNIIPGTNVTFTPPASGASGTFAGGLATATVATNAQGIAAAPVFTANSVQGSYNITATVAGVTAPANFALTNLLPPLAITTPSLPGGLVGVAYSQTVAATGGAAPYTWSIFSGTLPAGLTLNAATGAISGTPTATGTSNFTIMVTDSEIPAVSQSVSLSITISAPVAAIQVLPQPNIVGFGTSVQFSAEDAAGNTISAVAWSVSPATGAGTISATGLYQAPASGSTTATIMVIATALADPTDQNSVSFTFASNGLNACCTLPLQLTVAVGSTSNATGAVLEGVPSTSTVPFTLTCLGLPAGAGCSFTLPKSQGGTPIQSISGGSPKAFCYVFTTGPSATSAALVGPLSPARVPSQNARSAPASLAFVVGVLVLILSLARAPGTMPRSKLAIASIALICVTAAAMGACSGFSPANVAAPEAKVTPTGTYQIQLLATPPPGSGFVQNQLIVPLTVTGH